MNLHWLIPGTLGSFLILSSPALAASLESWRFDAKSNRLEFSTSGSVQPQAKLIFNPTRLVIDLPGVRFGRRQLVQPVAGSVGFRSLRVGQLNEQTSRIVVELAPGYTLDPNQVKFQPLSSSRWTAQLPTPKLIRTSTSGGNSGNINNSSTAKPEAQTTSPTVDSTPAATQIQDIQVTGDGFFIRTSGATPRIQVNRSSDRRSINIDIAKANISPNFGGREQSVNKFGVSRVEISQQGNGVRINLKVDSNSPDWRATASSSGLVLLPNRLFNSAIIRERSPIVRLPSSTKRADNNSLASVDSVELASSGTQLIIRSNQNLSGSGGWDKESMMFSITIPNAKLNPRVRGPILNANSPILRLRLEQKDERNVVIFVQPRSGIQIGRLNQITNQTLALELRSQSRITPPIALPPIPGRNPSPIPRPVEAPRPIPRPRVPNSRSVVVIDPGHGGKDPGAIGRGGLREVDVILPISLRVAQILRQNGVQVVMTRKSDFFVSLPGRVAIAEEANADLFVSIHANFISFSRPDINGLETYYFDTGENFARTVHRAILRSANVNNRGLRRARFYVLRKTSMPSILVETGYLTGSSDAAKLRNPKYRNDMAEGIARGILQYLRQR